ncbi:MAG: hypothetical protein U5K37_10030 [Natrialbaceae archaeon]|nr:hypothetical protein [Natrialbaceae archaeon]
MTNTRASPAAPFAGIGAYTGPSPTGEPTVYKLTPTVSSDARLLSGDVELEAWVTAQSIAATCCFDYNSDTSQTTRGGYNNSRSNRSTIRGPGDSDADADGIDDLTNERLQDLTGASDEDIEVLYEHLAGAPVISEQFTITVPDARLPGSDVALVDELTPRRLIEYVTGRAEADGQVYAWGTTKVARDDNTSPIYEGDAVGGESAIHRGSIMSGGDDEESPLHRPDTFASFVSGPVDTGIHLESHVVDGRVTVRPVNDPPQTTEATPALAVSADGSSSEPADFDEWGPELGESSTTSMLVCPILVAPPECPLPFPALLYVRRLKHAEQYIYTGGWVIDDGSLYENSVTLVAVGEPTEVIGVGAGDFDGDGYGDVMARHLSDEEARRGARLFDGTVSDAVAEGVLSEAERLDDSLVRKKPGSTTRQEEGTADVPVVIAQQGRIQVIHFTDTTAADDVKFKAGAELSKSVN